jgi:response regulator of citrate/malate metabolism
MTLLTDNGDFFRGDREKCLEAGMNNYLAKPVKATTLKEMFEQYLHQPVAHMPNLQHEAQEIAKFVMKDLRRIPSHKPKNRIDTQTAAKNANTEASITDAKQISPKTTTPVRVNNVENGLGTPKKSPRRSNSENEPGIISQGWRYGSSSRTLNQRDATSVSDGATDITLDKRTPPSK